MQQKTKDIQKELNQRSSRKGCANKHNNCGTVQQGYWWLRQHNVLSHAACPTQALFSRIIQTVNRYLKEAFFEGHTIRFPRGMGKLELVQEELKPDTRSGYLGNNLPVDWGATKKLWAEDAEAKEKKLLVRCTNSVIYRIRYNKNKTHYINKVFYGFAPYRTFQRELAQRAKNNEVTSLFKL